MNREEKAQWLYEQYQYTSNFDFNRLDKYEEANDDICIDDLILDYTMLYEFYKEEIERLNKRIKELEEGFKATTEDLCEESIEKEKLEKINKQLWEKNTRLSNGRELEQNAIDTLRDRIDKAIKGIEDYYYGDEEYKKYDYTLAYKIYNILKGSDKE